MQKDPVFWLVFLAVAYGVDSRSEDVNWLGIDNTGQLNREIAALWPMTTTFVREVTPEIAEAYYHGGKDFIDYLARNVLEVVELVRRLLKEGVRWAGSHAAELQMAKCVLRHCIHVKTPELVGALDSAEDGIQEVSETERIGRNMDCGERRKRDDFTALTSGEDEAPGQGVMERQGKNMAPLEDKMKMHLDAIRGIIFKKSAFKKNALSIAYGIYKNVSGFLEKHKLLGCVIEYLQAKFWQWVEAAR